MIPYLPPVSSVQERHLQFAESPYTFDVLDLTTAIGALTVGGSAAWRVCGEYLRQKANYNAHRIVEKSAGRVARGHYWPPAP